uniref:Acetyl-coenzyme A carboxylase carboxyl transferase subunit beta, chloroplastic n=1 Tax=Salomonia cantoniensis TaxID=174557 RepID=A0A7T7D5Z9_9FABA|nr:acetyl-CoA carboxylase carboxyltransferase beta subunit [Salomonia cantoniensis]QQL04285.1 acetyl-CoA carboxylase carboxyltransferase beta subunit [Salomonia cantoniensis]
MFINTLNQDLDSRITSDGSSWNLNDWDNRVFIPNSIHQVYMYPIESDSEDEDYERRNISENESSNDLDVTHKYSHLWVLCEDCYQLNYKTVLKSKMNICEHCGFYLKMGSPERIELSVDQGTWNSMDEDMVALDPIGWDLEDESFEDNKNHEENELYRKQLDGDDQNSDKGRDEIFSEVSDSYDRDLFLQSLENRPRCDSDEDFIFEKKKLYVDRIDFYQRETGLKEAVQTGTGQIKGIPVAIGFMEFNFLGGSMGSVVGEKITRLIQYATKQSLPLILVCASGGARMQEGNLSLMQMAKISSALCDYKSNRKSFYTSILTSPTTGGVTASFGMLGDIIIAEPHAYVAFAGKRVIEETLKIRVPEGSQETEYLFDKGLFDPVVPRNLLKDVLSQLLKKLYALLSLTSNENEIK